MITLIQRVTHANVVVDNETVGQIGTGILALVGVCRGDQESNAERLSERLTAYRIFEDDTGRMNLSIRDIQGQLLLVPQFTLAADTRKGNRPSFTPAAPPEEGERLFNYFVDRMRNSFGPVETGRFGANMQVSLCNNGPVTFWLEA